MIALIFSDSHGKTGHMAVALANNAQRMAAVLHLGDGYSDIAPFIKQYPQADFYQVTGNCDPFDMQSAQPPFLLVTLGGKRVLMTHGHRYGARTGTDRLVYLAEEQQADVCLFGHTHAPFRSEIGGILLFNPGSVSSPRSGPYPSYGVIEFAGDGAVRANIVEFRPEGCRVL